MPSVLFYLIVVFAALGVLSFLGKLVVILRTPSRATMDDAGDLLGTAGISGFTIGCAQMLYGQTHGGSMTSGAVVTAGGVLAGLAGAALKTRVQRNRIKNPEFTATALAERKALAEQVLKMLGQTPGAVAAPSVARQTKIIPRLFFVPFALFGAFFVCVGATTLVRGYNSTHWPRTDGVITSASVEQHQASGRHHHGYVYAANISYDYKVAGVAYTGTRLRFGMVESSAGNAQAIVDKYPPGRQVPVFYSPSDPASAVLQPGIFGGVGLELGIGGLFFAVGVAGLVWHRSQ
jgi:Protein of unknown function (DUF3592)